MHNHLCTTRRHDSRVNIFYLFVIFQETCEKDSCILSLLDVQDTKCISQFLKRMVNGARPSISVAKMAVQKGFIRTFRFPSFKPIYSWTPPPQFLSPIRPPPSCDAKSLMDLRHLKNGYGFPLAYFFRLNWKIVKKVWAEWSEKAPLIDPLLTPYWPPKSQAQGPPIHEKKNCAIQLLEKVESQQIKLRQKDENAMNPDYHKMGSHLDTF